MGIVMWIRVQWDRVAAGACILLGVLALVLGWVGTSGTPYVSEQLPYIVSGGLAGIFLLGLGSVLWLSADLRDEWRELRALRALHEQRPGAVAPQVLEPAATPLRAEGAATAARAPVAPRGRTRRVRTGEATESVG